ncbi:MAG TPA: ammonia-forming cytochrome c nitrite reductase subunit c552 [Firmicutes bacterium]|nr:ammonia-forming cytochrome c nitrite reductase subunit c552 [Bacillota bacterium]
MRERRLLVLLLAVGLVLMAAATAAANNPQDQWAGTKHNVKNLDTAAEDAPIKRDNCIACHDGQGFANNVVKRADLPEAVRGTLNSVDCGVCHGPRAKAMMDSGDPGKLSNGFQIKGAGSGALCIYCHNGRKMPDAAQKPAPHRSPQFDVVFAVGGARVAGESYPSSPHGANPDTCVSCHMAELDGMANHTFAVVDKPEYVEKACGDCHPGLATVNRTALSDYDGDKVVEGIQDEVKGLIAVLEKAVEEKEQGLGAHFGESHGSFHWVDKANAELKVPDALYYARFNLALVEEDGSYGVHNPAYVVALLQKSYKQLTGQDVPGAVLR